MPKGKRRSRRKVNKKLATIGQVKSLIIREQRKVAEYKVKDVYSDYYTVDYNGQIFNITNLIDQGNADYQRNGDSIYGLALNLHYNVKAVDTTNQFRVIIFRWKMDTFKGNEPQVNMILQPTGIGQPYAPLTPCYHDMRSQYDILYDNFHLCVNDSNHPSGQPYIDHVRKYIKCKRKIDYSYNDAGQNKGSDQLYMLVITDSAVVSHPSIQYWIRFHYVDQ